MKVRIAKVSLVISLGVALLVAATATIEYRARAQTSCPCHIFSTGTTPSSPVVANDSAPTALGVQFKPQVDGYITGVRFYKDSSMAEVHTGNLWSASGNLLASGTFAGETSTGWQDLVFSTPVQVSANTVYVASYFAPTGKYIASGNYFSSAVNNYPLLAPAASGVAGGNGVFVYGSGNPFPNQTYNGGNYWVDVTFRQTIDGSAPHVTSAVPSNGTTGVQLGSNLVATLDQTLNASTVDSTTAALTDSGGTQIPATVTYNDSAHTITLKPGSLLLKNTTYTATVKGGNGGVKNLDGTFMAADYAWSFTTGSDTGPWSLWNNAAPGGAPQTSNVSGTGKELGVTIHADSAGYLAAIRFYKPLKSTVDNRPVHIWSSSGTLL